MLQYMIHKCLYWDYVHDTQGFATSGNRRIIVK